MNQGNRHVRRTGSYSGDGAEKLAARLEERKADVEAVIRGVPGLMTWCLMRTPDRCTTFTLCKDKAGADQSVNIARDWIRTSALRHPPLLRDLAVRPATAGWADERSGNCAAGLVGAVRTVRGFGRKEVVGEGHGAPQDKGATIRRPQRSGRDFRACLHARRFRCMTLQLLVRGGDFEVIEGDLEP